MVEIEVVGVIFVVGGDGLFGVYEKVEVGLFKD